MKKTGINKKSIHQEIGLCRLFHSLAFLFVSQHSFPFRFLPAVSFLDWHNPLSLIPLAFLFLAIFLYFPPYISLYPRFFAKVIEKARKKRDKEGYGRDYKENAR